MSTKASSKRRLLGSAFLGLTLAGLLFAYYVAGPHDSTPPTDSLAKGPSQAAAKPPHNNSESPNTGPSFAATNDRSGRNGQAVDKPDAQPDSRLHEAELEHLSDVFLNSVYPAFQYGFQLNQEGRAAIDAFVASMPEDLSHADLQTLSAMIKDHLSYPEAEDLAFIITHLYRLEQEEARLMNEGAPITTMADQLKAQKQLSKLREQWFGPELAALLFGSTDDAPASSGQGTAGRLPDDNHPVTPPETLTEEQAELADLENAWEQKYQRFLAEKQVITNAGLSQNEKDKQIESLLQQHYTPQELEAARAYDRSRQ